LSSCPRPNINRASSRCTGRVTYLGVVDKMCRTKMNHYDIVFIGQLGMGTIVPFRGSPFTEPGGPALFASIGASCLGKKVATVTRISESDDYPLEPLKRAGIDVFALPGEIGQYRVVFEPADFKYRCLSSRQVASLKRFHQKLSLFSANSRA